MKTTWVHPETRPGEVFLSNMNEVKYSKLNWQSKRVGEAIYDGEGHRLADTTDWFPVFIKESELNQRIVDMRTARRQVWTNEPDIGKHAA